MKTIYIRNILSDLWRHKACAAAFVLLCAVTAIGIALRPGTPTNLTEEQEEELAAYEEQVREYDTAISDLEAGIGENAAQVEGLRDYVDHSIYMRIDPENIQTAAVQYGLQTEGNIGNILNSFITYINDGGLRESVAEGDQDLQPEYWRDIISCYINSNILNVTVIHYDAEKCARILEIVKQRVREHIPEVAASQGEFTLTEMETTQFVKADAGLVNGQNGHRNNLKGYETGLADLRSRLVSYRTNKSNYIKNNEPDFAPEPAEEEPEARMVRYLIAGTILGVIVACAAVTLRYILSDRLRSAEDLRDSGLNVLGRCRIHGRTSRRNRGRSQTGGEEGTGAGSVADRTRNAGEGTVGGINSDIGIVSNIGARQGTGEGTVASVGMGSDEGAGPDTGANRGTGEGTGTSVGMNSDAGTGSETGASKGTGVSLGTDSPGTDNTQKNVCVDRTVLQGRVEPGRTEPVGMEPEKSKLTFRPEPARTAMDIKVLAETQKKRDVSFVSSPDFRHNGEKGLAVFLDQMHNDGFCRDAAAAYSVALSELAIESATGTDVMESADDLKKMVEAGCCLLIAEAGKTTYQELKRHMELCERFRVTLLGCVVIE